MDNNQRVAMPDMMQISVELKKCIIAIVFHNLGPLLNLSSI